MYNVHAYTHSSFILSLSSLAAGVLQADPGVIREHDHVFRLFCHECQRVFHDRLIDKTDKKYFYGILSEMSSKYFSKVKENYLSLNVYMLTEIVIIVIGCQC